MRRLKNMRPTIMLCLLGGFIALGVYALRVLPHASGEAQPATLAGWGSEAIGELADTVLSFSFISVANACGLGSSSSSCARCHDGRRASVPPSEDATGPWHRDHASVPYSCVGCHQGNPRVLRQEVAHNKLVADPLAAPDRHCQACHRDAQSAALAERYLSKPPSSP